MIDIENAVFDRVRTALRTGFLTEYPDLTVLNDRPEAQQKFPCVVVTMDDNARYDRGQTVEPQDQYAEVMFTVDTFTALEAGGKTLAKQIAACADGVMESLNFTRMFFRETPNVDRKLKRYTARYKAVVQKPKVTPGEELPDLEYLIYRR